MCPFETTSMISMSNAWSKAKKLFVKKIVKQENITSFKMERIRCLTFSFMVFPLGKFQLEIHATDQRVRYLIITLQNIE